jgi:DNA mismatch repair ATPase MutL
MGNSVFRYFLLWMKQEMRKEAYHRITSLSKRRAQRQKQKMQQQQQQQYHQHQHQQQHQEQQEHQSSSSSSSKSQDVIINQGGWLSTVTTSFDDLWASYFGERDEVIQRQTKESSSASSDPEETSQTRTTTNTPTAPSHESQLWELAMHEGDEAYLKWMEAHIWTYVGLSAPLLGAINPLRSVISGENMGLPFTDDVARRLELSKFLHIITNHFSCFICLRSLPIVTHSCMIHKYT